MKPTLLCLVAAGSLALGCASKPACPAHHPGGAAPAGDAGAQVRALELPGTPGAGQPREPRVVAEAHGLKVATIVLRGGAVLPEHHAKSRVTIVALSGAGTLVVGSARHRLDATHAVLLGPGVPHSVEPDAGTDLVLLVHHLGGGASAPEAHH
ncbi:MAG: AraC family ligand binding domain-containing protein [Polyangiaceae bacterium]|nr:AraC family ligand binding domain-containing protein [Polyangiaceae bacterium]